MSDVSKQLAIEPFHPSETREKVVAVQINWGFKETWYFIFTKSLSTDGRVNGRILLGINADDTSNFAGGLVWISQSAVRMLHAFWVEKEFESTDALSIFAQAAKKLNIFSATSDEKTTQERTLMGLMGIESEVNFN